MKLPTNFLLSGSIEILISDVRLSATITPAAPPSPPESPRARQPDADSESSDSESELPTTAEDLAQSFLHSQPQTEQDQLLRSLYQDQEPLATSHTTASSTDDDDDEELGVGTSVGLPKMLANLFKGIGDRLMVRIRGVVLSLETTAPEDCGGEKIIVELEVEDVDVEGVTTDGITVGESERRKKDGKRCITLDSIKAYITAEASLFEPPSPPAASTVFGEASEASTERVASEMAASRDTVRDSGSMEGSTNTIRNQPPQSPSRTEPHAKSPLGKQDENEDDGSFDGSLDGSLFSENDRFADFEDSGSDEEVLAFAPSPFSIRASRGSFVKRRVEYEDDDEDSEDEGGAAFAPSMFPIEAASESRIRSPGASQIRSPSASQIRSPSPSQIPSPSASRTHSPSSSFHIRPPTSPSSPAISSLPTPVQPSDPYSSEMENSESGDEMDAEASRMLSESTIFTHSEAGSLYLSATSKVFDEGRPDEEEGRLKDQVDEEEVGSEEMDARLDALLGESSSPLLDSSLEEPGKEDSLKVAERRIKKQIFSLDRIEIFIPSLSTEESTTAVPAAMEESSTASRGGMEESHYPNVPGAFSMYASRRHLPTPSPPVSPPRPRRQTMVKIVDTKPAPANTPDLTAQTKPEIEIGVGKVEAAVDFTTARILGMVIEAVTEALGEIEEGKRRGADMPKPAEGGLNSEILVGEVALKLVDQLAGVYVDEGEAVHHENSAIVVECLLRGIKVLHSNLAQNVTTSRVEIKKFTLGDGKEDILSFIPPPPTKVSRKRGSHPPTLLDNDITFIISQSTSKKRINVTTLPVKLHFDLKRLEETLGAFGGVGGVLASTSTTASTVTLTKAKSQESPRQAEPGDQKPMDIKVNCQIGGLQVEIVGSTGKVGVETSPLKIRSDSSVVVSLDKIGIYGPDLPWDNDGGRHQVPTSVIVENTRVEFLGLPEQEDLARLLELLTPSKDQFVEDDDILIDTLIRQRQQGSMLRIGVGGVKATIEDLGVFVRLQQIGDDVIKVLTATDFVTQENRPGLLTLLHVDSVHARVEVGGGTGRIETNMGDVGVAHVSAPSLVALAVGRVVVTRNGNEELLGEGSEMRMERGEEGKPMAMLRIIGDELEPVVKLRLWNVRVEYRVETLMAVMDTTGKVTTEELAQEMAASIVSLAEKNRRDEDRPPLGLDVVIRDCVLGLNPLGLKSRGLVVLTDSRLQAAAPTLGLLSVGVEVKKAFVMLIDDTTNLVHHSDRQEPRRRKQSVNRQIDGFASQGYVSVVTVSSARVTLQIIAGPNGEKAIDLEVYDDLLLLESCADSTQTLLGIVNGLKPPLPEGDEVKYCTEVMPLDMFRSLTEDAFKPRKTMLEPDEDDDGDFVADDVPVNLAFVESYYGHAPVEAYTKDELADSMLDEDLGSIAPGPRKPLGVGEKGMLASFTEQVQVLDDDPLVFDMNYFGKARKPSTGSKRINAGVVNKWDSFRNRYVQSNHPAFGRTAYFPLRVKVKDVHVIWNLHDGYDWPKTRDTISQAVKRVEYKAAERRNNRKVSFDVDDEEESVIGDFLFNSIYIGIPANRDPKELSKAIAHNFDDHMSETSFASEFSSRPSSRSRNTEFSGGRSKNLKLSRSKTHKLQFELKGVCVDFLLFPPDSGETQSSVDVRVRDLEIFDNVPTSTWRKFVTYMQDAGERETGSNMVHLEVMNVKPVPDLAATEIVLRVCLGILSGLVRFTDGWIGYDFAIAAARGPGYA